MLTGGGELRWRAFKAAADCFNIAVVIGRFNGKSCCIKLFAHKILGLCRLVDHFYLIHYHRDNIYGEGICFLLICYGHGLLPRCVKGGNIAGKASFNCFDLVIVVNHVEDKPRGIKLLARKVIDLVRSLKNDYMINNGYYAHVEFSGFSVI